MSSGDDVGTRAEPHTSGDLSTPKRPAAPTTARSTISIDVHGGGVAFPIFDAKSRSLKKAFLGRAGGRITSSKVPMVEALRDIDLSMRDGDRVALIGHN